MFKKLLSSMLIAVSIVLGSAQATEPPGKSNPDTVVPKGPMNPASGAPADWPEVLHDNAIHHFFLLDRGEYGVKGGRNDYLWEAIGWIGGNFNKLWFKTEGEGLAGDDSPESTELQVKYGRAISPFFSAQIGLRYDVYPKPTRGFVVLNLQGLARYRFDVENQLYISEDGDVSFNGEYEYNLRLTQKLILQPRVEFTVAASRARRYDEGRGLRDTSLGLRLRYEIRREFAPYIGVRYEQNYGDTKDMIRNAGGDTSSTAFVVGLRAWY